MKFPLREKFSLPLEVVLDRQVATIKVASTAVQQSALLAVVRAEVADLESLTVVFLEQHTNESSDKEGKKHIHQRAFQVFVGDPSRSIGV